MKKLIFLIMFVLLSSGLLYADETKTFNTADGGIVKIKPAWGGFDIYLIYDPISKAPKNVKQYFKDTSSRDVDGKLKWALSMFNMKFLGKAGFELYNQNLYYKDFNLDETGEHPKIVLRDKAGKLGLSIDKIVSVLINYK